MKSGKKTITWLLVIALLSSAVPCTAGRAEAKTGKTSTKKYFMAGKHLYQKLSGNKVMLCGTKQKKGTLVVPAYVTKKGKKYKVTRITGYTPVQYTFADVSEKKQAEGYGKNGMEIGVGGKYFACFDYQTDIFQKSGYGKKVHMLSKGRYRKVVLPSTLIRIGDGAFSGNTSIREIEFAPKYKNLTIGRDAFLCEELEKLDYPEGTRMIGDHASLVNEVSIPKSVKKIGDGILSGCHKVTIAKKNPRYQLKQGVVYTKNGKTLVSATGNVKKDFVLPAKVTKIRPYAFEGADITSVKLSRHITDIAPGTFALCYELTKVTGMKRVQRIGYGAFFGSDELKTMDTFHSLKRIDRAAFWRTDGKLDITLPSSIEEIDTYAFSGYTQTTPINVKISSSKKFYSKAGCFIKVDGDRKLLLAMNLKCLRRKVCKVPEGVTDIVTAIIPWSYKMKKLVLPSTIRYINAQIYVINSNNGTVQFQTRIPPVFGSLADFGMITEGPEKEATVWCLVPKGTKAAYKKVIDPCVDLERFPYPAKYIEY